jgi:hypothetical protein
MLDFNFERQSNAADWTPDSIQLLGDDGNFLWSTVPVDIVVTLTIGYPQECTRPASDYIKRFISTDSPAYIEAFDNGIIAIEVPVTQMTGLERGQYPVFIKIETSGNTDQALIGSLPIVQGA